MIEIIRKIIKFFKPNEKKEDSIGGFSYRLQRLEIESDDIVSKVIRVQKEDNRMMQKVIEERNDSIIEYYLNRLFKDVENCELDVDQSNIGHSTIRNSYLNIQIDYNKLVYETLLNNLIVMTVYVPAVNKKYQFKVTDEEYKDKLNCLLLCLTKMHKEKLKNKKLWDEVTLTEVIINSIRTMR